MTVEERIARLEYVVATMATWLVQAQTGFGAQDARAIEKMLSDERRPDDSSWVPPPGLDG